MLTSAHAESRIALVIGNGNYQKAPSLSNSVYDANDMARQLRKLGFKVILKRNLNNRTMAQTVQYFGKLLRRHGGIGLFYFSGYALQFEGDNFLLPTDAWVEGEIEISWESLNVNRVIEQMRLANNSINIVILDACRDHKINLRSVGLAKMEAPKNFLIAYANAPNRVSCVNSRERNGFYTKYLLQVLRQNANLNIFEMLTKVKQKVMSITQGRQVPWLSAFLEPELCFGKCSTTSSRHVEVLLRACKEHLQAYRLTTGDKGTAFSCYKKVLKIEPNNAEALEGLEKIEAKYVDLIEYALSSGREKKAQEYMVGLRRVNPNSPHLLVCHKKHKNISNLLRTCQEHLQAYRLTTGDKGTAFSCYKKVLKIEPNNAEALDGLEKIEAKYVDLIEFALSRGREKKAQEYMVGLRKVSPNSPKLVAFKKQMHVSKKQQAVTPPSRVSKPQTVTPPVAMVEESTTSEVETKSFTHPPSVIATDQVFGDRFLEEENSFGPQMVWISGGSFNMGDLNGNGQPDEKPVHKVTFKRFAMGRYEVTFAEYDKFVAATGRIKPSDYGWGRGKLPVIGVSWEDAIAYAEWLSVQTGQKYRLPTEAEWEYAARAGTKIIRYWGNYPDVACSYANVYDKSKRGKYFAWEPHNCTDGYAKTAPVGSFKANSFGLFDMLGNVWEWTCSEYERKYRGKEKKCIHKIGDDINHVVLRGGGWESEAAKVRSAFREMGSPSYSYEYVGFRVVRE